ncbi:hypothetical protein [Shewanella sp.]|uniref:hypothetical protein n=1 Tax=Shewanella sp. TaxID=50422 RepID=UPI0040549E92
MLLKNCRWITFACLLFTATIFAEVSITEVQPLKFPSALMHFDKNTIVEVNWKGNIANSTNTTLLDSDYYQGRYLVTSDTSSLISLDVISLSNESFVDLKRIRIRYKNKTYNSFPVSGLANPGIKGEFIEVGAKLVAKKKTAQGVKYPQYLLTIQEQ